MLTGMGVDISVVLDDDVVDNRLDRLASYTVEWARVVDIRPSHHPGDHHLFTLVVGADLRTWVGLQGDIFDQMTVSSPGYTQLSVELHPSGCSGGVEDERLVEHYVDRC